MFCTFKGSSAGRGHQAASNVRAALKENVRACEAGNMRMQTGPAKKARRMGGTGAASKAASRAPAKRSAIPRKKAEPLAPPVGSRRGRGKECSTLSSVTWQHQRDRSACFLQLDCDLNKTEAFM